MKAKEVKRSWKALRACVQERWDKLTRKELDQIAGNYDRLIGKLQEKYGLTLLQAERELSEFRNRLSRKSINGSIYSSGSGKFTFASTARRSISSFRL